jgi:hypothetical protein
MGDQFGRTDLENIGLDTIEFRIVWVDLESLYITEVDRIQNFKVLLKPPWHGRPTTILFFASG